MHLSLKNIVLSVIKKKDIEQFSIRFNLKSTLRFYTPKNGKTSLRMA